MKLKFLFDTEYGPLTPKDCYENYKAISLAMPHLKWVFSNASSTPVEEIPFGKLFAGYPPKPVLWSAEAWASAVNNCNELRGLDRFDMGAWPINQIWLFNTTMSLANGDKLIALWFPPAPDGYLPQISFVAERMEDKEIVLDVLWSSTTPPEELPDSFYQIYAAAVFMKQDFVAVEPSISAQPSRQVRRQAQRTGERLLPELNVVTLNKTKLKHKKDFVVGSRAPIKHNCHYIVSGHWRQQWYPGAQIHKPKYIPPHIRGDLTKPLRPFRGTITYVK